jgi:hypothetical protein
MLRQGKTHGMTVARSKKWANLRLGRRFAPVATLVFALFASACAGDRGPHPELPFMAISSAFRVANLCSLGVSPEIRLVGVPQGTVVYRLMVTNVGVLRAPRQRIEVAATGPVIPEGALTEFELPCPSELQTMNYRFEVMAVAADRRPLAYGWNFITARNVAIQLEIERNEAKQPPPVPDTENAARISRNPSISRPTFFTP